MFQSAAFAIALVAAAAGLSAPATIPPQEAETILATPESMGLSREEFDRLGIPEGARILAGDFDRQESPEFEPPRFQDYRPLASALVEGAIVAAQVARFAQKRWRLAAPLKIGAPFNEELAAGTGFSSLFSEDEGSRPCVFNPNASFKPAKDDAGEIYTDICLHGEDDAGRFTRVRLRPYNRQRAEPRELPIEPAMLEPLPPGEWDAAFPPFTAVRRLRIVKVDARAASVALEIAFENEGDEGRPSVWETTSNVRTSAPRNCRFTRGPAQPWAASPWWCVGGMGVGMSGLQPMGGPFAQPERLQARQRGNGDPQLTTLLFATLAPRVRPIPRGTADAAVERRAAALDP